MHVCTDLSMYNINLPDKVNYLFEQPLTEKELKDPLLVVMDQYNALERKSNAQNA
jgi:hypothetical protein